MILAKLRNIAIAFSTRNALKWLVHIQYAAALLYREELLLYNRHPEMTFMQFSKKFPGITRKRYGR
jgi:hypothetical protein